MKFLAALLLVGCNAMQPDYVEVSPFYGDSGYDFNDPRALGFDGETTGLMFTVGWFVGETGAAMRNLSMLDVSPAGQLTMREQAHDGDGITVNVGDDKPESPPPEEDGGDSFTEPPETMDEALAIALWAISIAVALAIAAKFGVLKIVVGAVLGRRAAADLDDPDPPAKDKPKPDIKIEDYPT